MKVACFALFCLALSMVPVKAQESWTGQDKKLHLIAGATVAGTVAHVSDSKLLGFAAGSAVALAKEMYDSQHRDVHTPSYRDLIVTMVGAGLATGVPGLTVLPGAVVYRRSF